MDVQQLREHIKAFLVTRHGFNELNEWNKYINEYIAAEQQQIALFIDEPNGNGRHGLIISGTLTIPALPPDPWPPYIIYTDGGATGNPGNGGWGFVITLNGKGEIFSDHNRSRIPNTTNQRMELT